MGETNTNSSIGQEIENTQGMLNYIFQDAVGVYRNSSRRACFLRCFYLLPFRITVKYRFL